tara:strand:- start:1707 stop:2375 length:669 start_codon:yes stop_codon:yes gene_type:complete
MKKTILIADDEKDIIDLLSYNLTKNGYNVVSASDGSEVLLNINNNIDLLVLDIMMPKLDGYELCEIIKKNPATKHVPIIFLTAKNSSQDEYRGLLKGADDYVVKPVAIENLLLRIKNILNQQTKTSKTILSQSLSINLECRTVYNGENKILLTKTEFDLLYLFINSPGKVFKREELLDRVWGHDTIVTDRTIDVHITKLRKKIELNERIIFTSHGSGYYFEN